MSQPEQILAFWFGKDPKEPLKNSRKWWQKDELFDREIQKNFEADLKNAVAGKYDPWKESPESCLALLILLDQFSRNIFRGTPQAFAQDSTALATALKAIERGFDLELPPIQRIFFYLPLMHAEDRMVQKRCVEIFRKLLETAPPQLKDAMKNSYDFAVRHSNIIERFGRFPHRNEILGRTSTPEELEFLKTPGSSF